MAGAEAAGERGVYWLWAASDGLRVKGFTHDGEPLWHVELAGRLLALDAEEAAVAAENARFCHMFVMLWRPCPSLGRPTLLAARTGNKRTRQAG
jgi:hypothetical protein